MADEQPETRAAMDVDGKEDDQSPQSGLKDFITEQYELQKNAGTMEATKEIDDERTANFFNRALGESQRMSQEVAKSKEKLSKLQAEFGEEMMTAWRNEHAAQVLSPQQNAAMQRAEDGAFS